MACPTNAITMSSVMSFMLHRKHVRVCNNPLYGVCQSSILLIILSITDNSAQNARVRNSSE